MNQIIEITDDASFLGLVNAQLYASFIGEDWKFEVLKSRIIAESQKGHLVFWGTEVPNYWTVRICDRPIAEQDFKSFQAQINVTNGQLHLINYESLTVAAQFEDEQLTFDGISILLENGIYTVLVRQLFNPSVDFIEEEFLGFEIVLQKSTKSLSTLNAFKTLVWSDY